MSPSFHCGDSLVWVVRRGMKPFVGLFVNLRF